MTDNNKTNLIEIYGKDSTISKIFLKKRGAKNFNKSTQNIIIYLKHFIKYYYNKFNKQIKKH